MSFAGLSAASAGTLGAATGYSAFVFNNYSAPYSDSEGKLAVGGNFNVANYTVAGLQTAATTNLVVGGNATFTSGTIRGSAVVGGNVNFNNATVTGSVSTAGNYSGNATVNGTIFHAGTLNVPSWYSGAHQAVASVAMPINFAQAKTDLTYTSQQLAAQPATGSTVNLYGGLTLTGTNTGQNVFQVTAAMLQSVSGVTINIPAGAYSIINVIGATASLTDMVTLPNVGFNLDPSRTLWNLNGFEKVTMASFKGSILAPEADVTFAYGDLRGTLVANSFSGGGQLNLPLFDYGSPINPPLPPPPPPTPVTPVPLPAAVWGGGVLLLGLGAKKWSQRQL